MGIKRGLTTAYHPQADRQTEIMNQTLEVAICAHIVPEQDDWVDMLDSFQFAYNTDTHLGTGFSPAFLLYGFNPVNKSGFLTMPTQHTKRPITLKDFVSLPNVDLSAELNGGTELKSNPFSGWSTEADLLIESFRANQSQAQDALLLG